MKRMSAKKYVLIGIIISTFCMAVNGKTADQILEQRGVSPDSLMGIGIRFAAYAAIALTWPIVIVKNLLAIFR